MAQTNLDPRLTPADITDVAWCINEGTDEYCGILRVLYQYMLGTINGAHNFEQAKAESLGIALRLFSDGQADFEITFAALRVIVDQELNKRPQRGPAKKRKLSLSWEWTTE